MRRFARVTAIKPVALFLLVLAAIFLIAARSQTPQERVPNRPLTPREKAIEAVRIINTAEYNFRKDHHRFGSWIEVYGSGDVTALQDTWPNMRDLAFASNSEVIPDFRLTLLVSHDGDAYSLSLHQMAGHGCGISVFSDQSGLIYEGTVIDCPQIVDRPEIPNRH